MSPVHPARSRCGQSVGTERKLPRWLHTTFWCRRSRRASDAANEPVCSRSLAITTATMSSGAQRRAESPLTRAYRKPWNVNSGSHSSSPPAATKTSVCSLLMPTMFANHDPSAASVSVCSITMRWPGVVSRRRRRTRPTSTWPKSTIAPSARLDDRDRRQLEHPPDRLAGERAQHVVVAADLGDRHPFAVVESRRGPTRRAPRGGRTARRRTGRRTPTGPVALRASAPDATTSVVPSA